MRLLVLGGTAFWAVRWPPCRVTAGDEVVCAARGTSGAAGSRRHVRARSIAHDPQGYAAVIGGRSVRRGRRRLQQAVVRPQSASSALQATPIIGCTCRPHRRTRTTRPRASGRPTRRRCRPLRSRSTIRQQLENYGPCKVACEQAVLAAMGADHAFICRAGLIVGPEDRAVGSPYWPARMARGGEVLAPGSPGDPVQWVDVRDLAEWLVSAARTRLSGVFDGICASGAAR